MTGTYIEVPEEPNMAAKGIDYVPRNDAAFEHFFNFMLSYVAQKCSGTNPEWTHIPNNVRLELSNVYEAWYLAYSKTLRPHTPEETEAKNDQKKIARKAIRPFVNKPRILCPLVTLCV
jgi:hypothetical protein